MSKKPKQEDPIALPKRLLGVKIDKDLRRDLDARLEALPPAEAEAVVAAFLAALGARLEAPRHEVIEMFPSRETRLRSRTGEAP